MDVWVKINKSAFRTLKKTRKFEKIIDRHGAHCNSHKNKSMWFDFHDDPEGERAFVFAQEIVKAFPKMKITMGQVREW